MTISENMRGKRVEDGVEVVLGVFGKRKRSTRRMSSETREDNKEANIRESMEFLFLL